LHFTNGEPHAAGLGLAHRGEAGAGIESPLAALGVDLYGNAPESEFVTPGLDRYGLAELDGLRAHIADGFKKHPAVFAVHATCGAGWGETQRCNELAHCLAALATARQRAGELIAGNQFHIGGWRGGEERTELANGLALVAKAAGGDRTVEQSFGGFSARLVEHISQLENIRSFFAS
jgi:hypothetical protein